MASLGLSGRGALVLLARRRRGISCSDCERVGRFLRWAGEEPGSMTERKKRRSRGEACEGL